jgi:hypothetical protein
VCAWWGAGDDANDFFVNDMEWFDVCGISFGRSPDRNGIYKVWVD